MDIIYISCDDLPEWLVQKFFLNKEYITIQDLINTIENLDD